jgi:hypothetical protein
MDVKHQPASRRGLLAALSVGAAAVAVALRPGARPEPVQADAAPLPTPEKGGGYALTDHVKRYYQTTRV